MVSIKHLCHFCSQSLSSYAHLAQRQVIAVRGPQSSQLLQGLFTNDIHRVSVEGSIFTHLLNVKGRVLFDNIVYSTGQDSFLIEVDKDLKSSLFKLLTMYNIRSKAEITQEDIKIYASFSTATAIKDNDASDGGFRDPRLPLLGYRYLDNPPKNSVQVSEDEYNRFRVGLGISEGAQDIAHGKDFPFEHNLDFLDGVSFNKGCYIGQELTARTHHVGETRKRVVPVKLSGTVPHQLLPAKLFAGKRAAGKLVSVYGDIGLAVVRFPYLDSELKVAESHVMAVGRKPEWWPKDLR